MNRTINQAQQARTLADYRPQHDEDCTLVTRECDACGDPSDAMHHDPSRPTYHQFTPNNFCSCGLDALLACVRQAVPQQHRPPIVHCKCMPSNLEGAPPFGVYCWHTRTWVDGAAQQDDYECPKCKRLISVNVTEWAQKAVPSVIEQQKTNNEKTFARSDQPQPGSCDADPRGDVKPSSMHRKCLGVEHVINTDRTLCCECGKFVMHIEGGIASDVAETEPRPNRLRTIRDRIIDAGRKQYHDPDHHAHADMCIAVFFETLAVVQSEFVYHREQGILNTPEDCETLIARLRELGIYDPVRRRFAKPQIGSATDAAPEHGRERAGALSAKENPHFGDSLRQRIIETE